MFKSEKRDKKAKDDDQSDVEKPSAEYSRDSPIVSPPTSGRASPIVDSSGYLSPTDTRRQEVQTRQPSRGKLQKPPPSSGTSPVREQAPEQPKASIAELQGSEAAHEMASTEPEPEPETQHRASQS